MPKIMRRLRILVVSSDTFPPTRVDVAVLFGAELAARGHEIDWILQSEEACPRAYVTAVGIGPGLGRGDGPRSIALQPHPQARVGHCE